MGESSREVNVSVDLAGLRLRSPLMLTSGVLGMSTSLMAKAAEAGAGAVVTKTLTYTPRPGYENPTFVRVGPSSYLNAMGLPNPGFKEFAEELRGAKLSVPVICSLAPSSEDETVEMCEEMDGVSSAIELNLSCPHVKGLGSEIGTDPELVRGIVRAARSATDLPLLSKISPNAGDVSEVGIAAVEAGTDCLVACNTLRAMAIDVEAISPVLANTYGGLSGRALHPVAVRLVHELYAKLGTKVLIVGSGGAFDWKDAVEFFLAGASAVQIGSAVEEKGLTVFSDMLVGIRGYMVWKGFRSITDMVGLAVRKR